MSGINYYLKESLEELQDKLHKLKTTERMKISEQLAEARDKGDLSENAEYEAAKEAQAFLEIKIAKLEETLASSRILPKEAINTSKVSILTKVTVKNHQTNRNSTYTLVSESEANIKENKISITSPIGKGLLDKKVGEVVNIKVPAGMIKLKILDITA
jgi:transcription elongation factor GreA